MVKYFCDACGAEIGSEDKNRWSVHIDGIGARMLCDRCHDGYSWASRSWFEKRLKERIDAGKNL